LIRGFQVGILIEDSDYVQVSLTTVAGNTFGGIEAVRVSYLTVGGNVIAMNVGNPVGLVEGGLRLIQSTGAQVTGNLMVGNYKGIELVSGDSNVLTGNAVNGNSGSGILMGNPGDVVPLTNSRVSSNTTSGNGNSGIQVQGLQPGSSGNEIFSNTSSVGNTVWDLEDDNAGCGTDFWSGNVFFTTNNPACVH
jgi:parallel beta-helix repeat protein